MSHYQLLFAIHSLQVKKKKKSHTNIYNCSANRITKLNETELKNNIPFEASWHQEFSDSAYIFIGNLPKKLTEEDILTIFSQYGVPTEIKLARFTNNNHNGSNKNNKYNDGHNSNYNSSNNPNYNSYSNSNNGPGNYNNSKKFHNNNDGNSGSGNNNHSNNNGESKGFAFLKYEDQRSTVLAVDNLNGITILDRNIRVDHCYYKVQFDEYGNEMLNEHDLRIRKEMLKDFADYVDEEQTRREKQEEKEREIRKRIRDKEYDRGHRIHRHRGDDNDDDNERRNHRHRDESKRSLRRNDRKDEDKKSYSDRRNDRRDDERSHHHRRRRGDTDGDDDERKHRSHRRHHHDSKELQTEKDREIHGESYRDRQRQGNVRGGRGSREKNDKNVEQHDEETKERYLGERRHNAINKEIENKDSYSRDDQCRNSNPCYESGSGNGTHTRGAITHGEESRENTKKDNDKKEENNSTELAW